MQPGFALARPPAGMHRTQFAPTRKILINKLKSRSSASSVRPGKALDLRLVRLDRHTRAAPGRTGRPANAGLTPERHSNINGLTGNFQNAGSIGEKRKSFPFSVWQASGQC